MKIFNKRSLISITAAIGIIFTPINYTVYGETLTQNPTPKIVNHQISGRVVLDFKNRTVSDSKLQFNVKIDPSIEMIWIKLKKGTDTCDYYVPNEKGKLRGTYYLPYGPGKYSIIVYENTNRNTDTFYEYKTFTVINKDNTPSLGGRVLTDSKLEVNLPVETEVKEVLINVIKGDQKWEYIGKVADGVLLKNLYFPYGKGTYDVAMYKTTDPSQTYYDDGILKFKVVNNDERDMQYLLPTDDVESDAPEIIEMAKEITKDCKTDMERAKAIHDWIAKNIVYDTKNYYAGNILPYSALETLRDRIAVCNGYAKLNAAMNRALGIKARVVEGISFDPDKGETYDNVADRKADHNWNEVFIDGRWVVEDPTWDAGSLNEEEKSFKFNYQDKYFDPTSEEFSKDHRKTGIEDMRK